VVVTDLSAQLAGEIKAALDKHNESKPKRQILLESLDAGGDVNSAEQRGKTGLRSGSIDAYVVIDANVIEGAGRVYFYTYKSKPTNIDAQWTVQGIVDNAVVEQRCKARNISSKLLNEIRNVPVEHVELGAGAEEQRVQSETQAVMRMMVPFFFMFLMYMGIVGISQQMLSSVIEEKNSRIIEVLLSAAGPFELMAGKILGLGGIGLTVVGLWTTAGYGTALWRGLDIEITGAMLFYFLIFYVLGFLLFSSMLAAIGSICNTLKETQGLMMPLILIFVLPLISWYKLVQSPDGVFARVLSLVPPVSPLVMILRMSASSHVPAVEIIASIALLVAALLLSMWLAGRIFQTGILMYGKRPSLREIFRWLLAR
jgi:ABC-2 type transport system permease protein